MSGSLAGSDVGLTHTGQNIELTALGTVVLPALSHGVRLAGGEHGVGARPQLLPHRVGGPAQQRAVVQVWRSVAQLRPLPVPGGVFKKSFDMEVEAWDLV